MPKFCVIIGLKKEKGYKTTYKNDWMESIKRLVQSKFEKFGKNCKQRLCSPPQKKKEKKKAQLVDLPICKLQNFK